MFEGGKTAEEGSKHIRSPIAPVASFILSSLREQTCLAVVDAVPLVVATLSEGC